jgi:hypothetical protein
MAQNMQMQGSFCNAVVRLKLELYQVPRCAVLLDNYNALYWRTEYYDADSLSSPLRRIDAQELTLGANLRVLSDRNVGRAFVVAAVTLSGTVPDVPADLDEENAPYTSFTVPPLSTEELGMMLLYYRCVPLHPMHVIDEDCHVQCPHTKDGIAVYLFSWTGSFSKMCPW